MADDALVPFVFEGAAVRGACVRMDRAAHDALAAHDYPAPLARVLAELMAAAALLAASLKFRGSLIVQLAGPGLVRLAVRKSGFAPYDSADSSDRLSRLALLRRDVALRESGGWGGRMRSAGSAGDPGAH